MITNDKIKLFARNKSKALHAFGSAKYPQTVTNSDKELYWEIYQELEDACKQAIINTGLSSDFYTKPKKYSKIGGVRAHRPLDLWCAIRNNNSEDFNEMPQIYCIVSDAGIEVGFAVSIPESDYSNSKIKIENRSIIPNIHKKLPQNGKVLTDLEDHVQKSSNLHLNSQTRKIRGQAGFDAYNTVTDMFADLKSQRNPHGGGCIAKIISPSDIPKSGINLHQEMEDALVIFSDLQKLCLPSAPDKKLIRHQKQLASVAVDQFDPANIEEGKKKILTSIAVRRGQPKFRSELMTLYDGQCLVSGCRINEVLQAAHIVPYRGPETNKIDNGLVLRSDIHDLFDEFLITINPSDLKIIVSTSLNGTEYEGYRSQELLIPMSSKIKPSQKALQWHYQEAKDMGRI